MTAEHGAPKISIVTVTNGSRKLRGICESIDSQDYTDWEHIVVVNMPKLSIPESWYVTKHANRKIVRCEEYHDDMTQCEKAGMEAAESEEILYWDESRGPMPAGFLRTSMTQS